MLRKVSPGEKTTPTRRADEVFLRSVGLRGGGDIGHGDLQLAGACGWRTVLWPSASGSCQLYVEVGSDVSCWGPIQRVQACGTPDTLRSRPRVPDGPRVRIHTAFHAANLSRLVCLLLLVCARGCSPGSPAEAAAQGFEPVGTRAQGMGGAFVAVADDASGDVLEPGRTGLHSYLRRELRIRRPGTVERARASEGARPGLRGAAATRVFAAALPVLGVSYYRLRTCGLSRPLSGPTAGVREDANTAFVGEAASTWNLGVTLVQSIGDAVVVGTHAAHGRSWRGGVDLRGSRSGRCARRGGGPRTRRARRSSTPTWG